MITIVPSGSGTKANSTEKKQEIPSKIHPVKLTSRDWILETKLRKNLIKKKMLRKKLSMRRQAHIGILCTGSFCGKGENISPELVICHIFYFFF